MLCNPKEVAGTSSGAEMKGGGDVALIWFNECAGKGA